MFSKLFSSVCCCFGATVPLHRRHITLNQHVTRDKRIIIVGDIHGCAEQLEALLLKTNYRSDSDVLISVGDIVNKGPDSVRALSILQRNKAFAVLGNHDIAVLDALGRGHGGDSRKLWAQDLNNKAIKYLQSLPLSIFLEEYRILIVHAGLVPGIPLEDQDPKDLLEMRDLIPMNDMEEGEAGVISPETFWESVEEDARIWATGAKDEQDAASTRLRHTIRATTKITNGEGRPWGSVWQGDSRSKSEPIQHVCFGHDAMRQLQLHHNATGLDGGCVYGGSLHALVLPAMGEHGKMKNNGDMESKRIKLESIDVMGDVVSVAGLAKEKDK